MSPADRAVRITEYQTSPKQRDSVAESVIVRILCRQHTDPAGARDAIATAVADGDLVETEGDRYAVANTA